MTCHDEGNRGEHESREVTSLNFCLQDGFLPAFLIVHTGCVPQAAAADQGSAGWRVCVAELRPPGAQVCVQGKNEMPKVFSVHWFTPFLSPLGHSRLPAAAGRPGLPSAELRLIRTQPERVLHTCAVDRGVVKGCPYQPLGLVKAYRLFQHARQVPCAVP